jgi:hypothetical protein
MAGTKLTVNLGERASAALDKTSTATGETRTTTVNKALTIYADLVEAIARGDRLYVRPADAEELQRMLIY